MMSIIAHKKQSDFLDAVFAPGYQEGTLRRVNYFGGWASGKTTAAVFAACRLMAGGSCGVIFVPNKACIDSVKQKWRDTVPSELYEDKRGIITWRETGMPLFVMVKSEYSFNKIIGLGLGFVIVDELKGSDHDYNFAISRIRQRGVAPLAFITTGSIWTNYHIHKDAVNIMVDSRDNPHLRSNLWHGV